MTGNSQATPLSERVMEILRNGGYFITTEPSLITSPRAVLHTALGTPVLGFGFETFSKLNNAGALGEVPIESELLTPFRRFEIRPDEAVGEPSRNTLWSPLRLEVLMHFYTTPQPFPQPSSRLSSMEVIEAIKVLVSAGMLYLPTNSTDVVYRVPKKGRFFIEHILSVQFPLETVTFEIPKT